MIVKRFYRLLSFGHDISQFYNWHKEELKAAFKNRNQKLLWLIADHRENQELLNEPYLLPNGHDIRGLRFHDEVKEIESENTWTYMQKWDKDIVGRIKEDPHLKKLFEHFFLDMSTWHDPFEVEGETMEEIQQKINERYGKPMKIWKYENSSIDSKRVLS